MLRDRIPSIGYHFILAKRVTTILLWLTAGIDASPRWFDLSTEEFVLCVALAITGSFAWIHRTQSRPATEMFMAGKDIGRREALLEMECANVRRMSDHPSSGQRLRAVE